jgi:putative membrane protein insertion efficiency factor
MEDHAHHTHPQSLKSAHSQSLKSAHSQSLKSAHSHGDHSMAARIAIACLTFPILVYRYAVSPFFPSACRFGPSCSAYAYDALTIHGPLKGSLLAVKRLARCHPISWLGGGSGFDPVPKRRP